MEEDTGKSLHVGGSDGRIHGATHSLLDYNRAGVPLVEIVTEPDIRSAEVAAAYVTELREMLRALGVSEVRMEQGQLRCDANVSLRPRGAEEFGTRTETKNLNSIRSVERAVTHEIGRQAQLLDAGSRIVQETRHFDEARGITQAGRTKEEATDYRYFPEPDLLPVALDTAFIDAIRDALPELPAARRARLCQQFGFSPLELEQMIGAGRARPGGRHHRRGRRAGCGARLVAERAGAQRLRARGRACRSCRSPAATWPASSS